MTQTILLKDILFPTNICDDPNKMAELEKYNNNPNKIVILNLDIVEFSLISSFVRKKTEKQIMIILLKNLGAVLNLKKLPINTMYKTANIENPIGIQIRAISTFLLTEKVRNKLHININSKIVYKCNKGRLLRCKYPAVIVPEMLKANDVNK